MREAHSYVNTYSDNAATDPYSNLYSHFNTDSYSYSNNDSYCESHSNNDAYCYCCCHSYSDGYVHAENNTDAEGCTNAKAAPYPSAETIALL
jgi:hypothetical protein